MSTLPSNGSIGFPSFLSSAAAQPREGAVPCLPATSARGSRAWPAAQVPAARLPAFQSHPLWQHSLKLRSGKRHRSGEGGATTLPRTRAGWPLGLEVGFEVLQEVSAAGFPQARGNLILFQEILGVLLSTPDPQLRVCLTELVVKSRHQGPHPIPCHGPV